MIEFSCTGCGKVLKGNDSLEGKRVRCPHCQAAQTVMRAPPPAFDDDELRLQPLEVAPAAPVAISPPPMRSEESAEPRSADLAAPPKKIVRLPQHRKSWRFMFFALILVPLGVSLLGGEEDLEKRFVETVVHHPEVNIPTIEVRGESFPDLDGYLDRLPEHQLDGVQFSSRTLAHWAIAGIAGVLFLVLLYFLFERGSATTVNMFLSGLFTSTIGIALLIAFQYLAMFSRGITPGGGVIAIILWIIKGIGWMYVLTEDPNASFPLLLLGFTLGVALCEEVTKSLPIWLRLRKNFDGVNWRGACMWGLASGIGFGVGEGVMYAARHYNGVMGPEIYFVRFISCAGLHAVWGGAVGLMLFRHPDLTHGDLEWGDWLPLFARVFGPAMLLHGLYDALLTRELKGLAMLTAAASFGWLSWLIEMCKREEAQELAAAEL